MLKLVSCEFIGLQGFEGTLKINPLAHVTSFIGPNGTGKSTILRVLNLALNILSKATICDEYPEHEPWDKFEKATLHFETDTPITVPKILQNQLGEIIHGLTITIHNEKTSFVISLIENQNSKIGISSSFFAGLLSKKSLTTKQQYINDLNKSIASTENTLRNIKTEEKQKLQKQMATDIEKKKNIELELEADQKISVNNHLNEDLIITRNAIESLLSKIKFPKPIYIGHRQSPHTSIKEFISKMIKLKKGNKTNETMFQKNRELLEQLLKNDVDINENDERQENIYINNIPYEKASSGTEITLSYFAMTHMENENCIILWDEPENGLHPTRRYKLLDLVLNDKRQYVLATHATEFAPINYDAISIWSCDSNYADSKVSLSISPVVNRQGAFETLSALGVQPARILFTANVTIWVEGPTELIFYQFWLKKILPTHIIEGFHYTFMQYGGGLINYIEADDNTEHSKYLFDILSLCRHPVILCDSDFSSEPDNNLPPTQLKEGVKRLYQEVAKINHTRPNAALLKWTIGREIENYLPPKSINHAIKAVWKAGNDDEFEKISKHLEPNKYEHYHETLAKVFKEHDILTVKKAPKGITRWGEKNKVEFMRQALLTNNLEINDLLLNAEKEIKEVAGFIEKHANFHS